MLYYHATQFAIFLFTSLQNLSLRFTKSHQLPTPTSDPCWGFVSGPIGTFVLQTPKDSLLILGRRAALYQNAEDVEGKENGNGVSHSIPVDQRIWRSAVSSSSGVGLPDRKRVYCLIRLTECLSWTKN